MLRIFLFAFWIASVAALDLEDAEPGECPENVFRPVASRPSFGNMVNNFKYMPAGSRYDLYLFASGHPRFRQMRERELRDNMCLTNNGTDALGNGAAIGFGGTVLGTFEFTPQRDHPAVYDYTYTPTINGGGVDWLHSTQIVTLTDYETFVFLANCFTIGSQQFKAWEVMSNTPNLSTSTRRIIESHAASLGFNPANTIFLNYDNCEAGGNQRGGGRAGGNQTGGGRAGGNQTGGGRAGGNRRNEKSGEIRRGWGSGRSGWSK